MIFHIFHTSPENQELTAEQELALKEYSWFICWHASTDAEIQEREAGIMKWKLQIDQLGVPQRLVDKIIEEKQREYSQALVQTISGRASSVMSRSIGKASGL